MASKYHPGIQCDECYLCGKKQKYYDHYKSFKEEEKGFIVKHLGEHPPDSSCICKADHIEAAKRHNEIHYIPRWKREDVSSEIVLNTCKCSYPNCIDNTKLIVPRFMSPEELQTTLITPPPHRLCNKHYQLLYHQSVSSIPCASCGVKPKRGTAFTRHSPNPEQVCKHFLETTGFESNMSCVDYICSTCYKLHVTVLNNNLVKVAQQTLAQKMKDKLNMSEIILYNSLVPSPPTHSEWKGFHSLCMGGLGTR